LERKQIAKVISLVAKSSVLPVLEQACFHGGNLSFTDLNHSVIFKNIGVDKNFLVDAKDFSKVLMASDNTLQVGMDSSSAYFKAGKRTYTLSTMSADDFPKIAVPEVGVAIKLGELTD